MKKVGLTALAASLVSFSANAGELTVSGAASLNVSQYSGEKANTPKTFSMGDQITFSGGGELDNGMNVSLSFTIDDGDNGTAGSEFDAHSITVSSETMGTLTLAGEGGSSATTSVDGSVAGDIWDGFDGAGTVSTGITGAALADSDPGNESIFYTLPSMMDGLSVFASLNPQESAVNETETGYGATYTGVDGLSISYATTDIESGTTATSGDNTALKATYAYGPVTVGYSKADHDTGTSSSDTELTAWNVAYTVSDELSISYGAEELSVGGTTTDAEYSALVVAYTSGGMTLTGKMEEAENVDNTTSSAADQEFWGLTAAFAF
ncbi:porin [Candidatus Pelagibacter sp. HIMB1587]|uniref:porin n=1 Tax=Candidatus Pelagibacter sp. HIMB1587 TaxID=3413354 RepID=UPI003F85AA31